MKFAAPSAADRAAFERLIGRPASGKFRVVLRRINGDPVVIENAPHLDDGTPMPTLYWLVDPSLREQVSRIESLGGVRRFEAELDAEAIKAAHETYERRRDGLIEHPELPKPSGGVGGTRTGLKCLHAHLAAHLAGLADPVGAQVALEIDLGTLLAGEAS